MFDNDVMKSSSHGRSVAVDDDSVRLTLNGRGPKNGNEKNLRVSIGKNLCNRMRFIRGDRVEFCYGRRERVIGLKKTNDHNMGNRLQTSRRSRKSRSEGGMYVTFTCTRLADDVKDILTSWIGSGKVFSKVHDNQDTLYFFIADAEESESEAMVESYSNNRRGNA